MKKIPQDKISTAVFDLVYKNKIFIKCPKCSNYLCLFEIYNCHCNKCGDLKFNELILIAADPD